MLLNIFIYGILLTLCDALIRDEYGARRASSWTRSLFGRNAQVDLNKWLETQKKAQVLAVDTSKEDSDVGLEREKALSGMSIPTSHTILPLFAINTSDQTDSTSAIKIVNLIKVYRGGKIAVRNTCLTLEEGKLLALLGQNGAGKSTTMSILGGLTPATAGDALIYGLSVANQMPLIRSMLGVCPQHDILFEDLTAKEHIELYAGLKGVPKEFLEELFEERLKAVRLWTVKNVRAGTYSVCDLLEFEFYYVC
jgi:ABC-type glutathione transport system ATPase component